MELYLECIQENSAIAYLNLDYLYLNAFGCDYNFDVACYYYKKACELGLQEGLEKY